MHKEIKVGRFSAYIGWRWRQFAVGFGVMVLGGVYIWADLGFLYAGVEVW